MESDTPALVIYRGPWPGPDVSNGQYDPAVANFAVRLVHGPGWDPSRQIREQDGWDGHAAFMDGLVDDGFIILGGPVGDGEQTLHVVKAADEDEVRARLCQDPWASAGLLRIGTIAARGVSRAYEPTLPVRLGSRSREHSRTRQFSPMT